MAETSERKGKPTKTWPAESEIEAYRRELEASFLLEESKLEARRDEVIERLDTMETNTLLQAHGEQETMKARRDRIMGSVQDVLDRRFQTFLSGFNRQAILEELTLESLNLLCPTNRDGEGVPL
jgi:hypothetical protein